MVRVTIIREVSARPRCEVSLRHRRVVGLRNCGKQPPPFRHHHPLTWGQSYGAVVDVNNRGSEYHVCASGSLRKILWYLVNSCTRSREQSGINPTGVCLSTGNMVRNLNGPPTNVDVCFVGDIVHDACHSCGKEDCQGA